MFGRPSTASKNGMRLWPALRRTRQGRKCPTILVLDCARDSGLFTFLKCDPGPRCDAGLLVLRLVSLHSLRRWICCHASPSLAPCWTFLRVPRAERPTFSACSLAPSLVLASPPVLAHSTTNFFPITTMPHSGHVLAAVSPASCTLHCIQPLDGTPLIL